jgi:hypothetical protein
MAQIFWDNFFLQKAQIKWDGWSIFFLRIYNLFCSFSLLILSQINICSFKKLRYNYLCSFKKLVRLTRAMHGQYIDFKSFLFILACKEEL